MKRVKKERIADKDKESMLSKRISIILFSLIGIAFFFCMITGSILADEGNIRWSGVWQPEGESLIAGIPVIWVVLSGSLFCGLLSGILLTVMIYRKTQIRESVAAPYGRRCFLLSWLLIFVAWVPYFLAYYPGICSYDFSIQTGQIESGAYNDHHPIAHTLLIEGAMKLGGKLFGDVNGGIAVYSLVQMLLLSAAMAFVITLLYTHKVQKGWLVALLLYGMFFPFHGYLSVSVTKDTLFSVFFLMQMALLLFILDKDRNALRPDLVDAGFFAVTLGVVLFRNNGRYALIVLLLFLVAAFCVSKGRRRLFGRILGNAALGFVTGSVLLSVLFSVTGAQQGDRREMLSMPIQQLARTMIYHGGVGVLEEDDNSMDEVSKSLINDFILNEAYKEYRGDIADPVKRHTNTYVARYRPGDFVKTYGRLLLAYPGDYVNAVLAVNAGYLYPNDVSHSMINQVDAAEGGIGLGYVQTRWVESELTPRGIYKDSKWEWLYEKLEWFADGNKYLDIPVLKYLFVPGVYLWIYLLLAGYLLVHRRYTDLLPFGLILGYFGTLLLGPTVQLRYIYPVMICLPLFLLWFLRGKKEACQNV